MSPPKQSEFVTREEFDDLKARVVKLEAQPPQAKRAGQDLLEYVAPKLGFKNAAEAREWLRRNREWFDTVNPDRGKSQRSKRK